MMVLKIMIRSANLAVACSLPPLFIQAFRLVVSFESSFSLIQVFRLLVRRFVSLVSLFSSLTFSVSVGSFKQNFNTLISSLIDTSGEGVDITKQSRLDIKRVLSNILMLRRAQRVPSLPTFIFPLAAATWVFSTGHLLKTLLSYWLYACLRHQASLLESIALHGFVTRVWIKSVITMQPRIETIDQLLTNQLKPCACYSHTRAKSRPKNLF